MLITASTFRIQLNPFAIKLMPQHLPSPTWFNKDLHSFPLTSVTLVSWLNPSPKCIKTDDRSMSQARFEWYKTLTDSTMRFIYLRHYSCSMLIHDATSLMGLMLCTCQCLLNTYENLHLWHYLADRSTTQLQVRDSISS